MRNEPSARRGLDHSRAYNSGARLRLAAPVVGADAKRRADIAAFVQSAAGRSSLMREGVYRMGWIIQSTVTDVAGPDTDEPGASSSRIWLGSDRRIYLRHMTGDGLEPTAAHAHNLYALFDRVGFVPNP